MNDSMNASFIEVGGCYSNGKGRIRKVLDIGPQYKYYDSARDTECLTYMVLNDGSKKNRGAGETGNASMASFCAWAKEKLAPLPTIPTQPFIAYLNKDGRGLNNSYYPDDPFLEEGFDTIQDALARAEGMKAEGFIHVSVFAVPLQNAQLPAVIGWDYVNARIIRTAKNMGA